MIAEFPTEEDAKALLDTVDIEKMRWRQVTVATERMLQRFSNFVRAHGGGLTENPNYKWVMDNGPVIYWDTESTPIPPIPPMPTRAEAQAAFHRWQQSFPAAANYMAAVQSKYEKTKIQRQQKIHPAGYRRAKRGVLR